MDRFPDVHVSCVGVACERKERHVLRSGKHLSKVDFITDVTSHSRFSARLHDGWSVSRGIATIELRWH